MDNYAHEINWGFSASLAADENKKKLVELEAEIEWLKNNSSQPTEEPSQETPPPKENGALLAPQELRPGDDVNTLLIPFAKRTSPPKPNPEYSLRMLNRSNMEDWRWHPHVMLRVMRFCEEYENQGDQGELVRNLQQSFTMDDPPLMVVAIFRNAELIGHILCERSLLYFKPIVTVHQYLLDHGISPEARRESVRLIRKWSKDTGPKNDREPADYIQWLVWDKKLSSMYQRMFKAKPHLLLMRLAVEEEGNVE